MRTVRGVLAAIGVMLVSTLGLPSAVRAQLGVGTWERQSDKGSKGLVGYMTMTVEQCCKGGYRVTYHITINDTKSVMKVESPFDGTEVPVLVDGKPSGETMAIKRVDDRHSTTVIKMNGQPFGTSKSTLSADGKTLTAINEIVQTGGVQPKDTQTEVWIKK
jgi:hypothetical protein